MIELTEEQIEKAMRYIIRGATAEQVNLQDTGQVVRWMILNPIPEDLEKIVATQDEEERQARIKALREELTNLEGDESNV